VAASGNVTVGVAGTASVGTFATTGLYVAGVSSVSGNITGANLIIAGYASITGNVNIGNATGVTFANASGIRAWTYYNNTAASLDTVFL
jgi:putative cofactor-binding repeat protein